MNGINFFGSAPDPQQDPSGLANAKAMAQALMRQGSTPAQGQNVNGNYVAPSPLSYAGQVANSALGGMQMNKVMDAQRASNILNGGTGVPAYGGGFAKIAGLLGGG